MSFQIPVDTKALNFEGRLVNPVHFGSAEQALDKGKTGLPLWEVQCLVEVPNFFTGVMEEQQVSVRIPAAEAPRIQKGSPVRFRGLTFECVMREKNGRARLYETFAAEGIEGAPVAQKAGE